jgi:uncharacterized protein YecE (DUF72 family)
MSDRPTPIPLIGMGGWDLPPFDGVFYPPKPGNGFRKLEWYARFFDFVELNASFYNTTLSPAQAVRWLKDVAANPRFQFSVKLYRGFTHTLNATARDAMAVQRLLDPLQNAGRLAGLVMQFPSGFAFTAERLEYLGKLSEAFNEVVRFAELRHRSWDTAEVRDVAAAHRICLVNTDLPRLPQHMPLRADAWDGTAYFRMMGQNAESWNDPTRGDRYLYRYSQSQLKDLVRLISGITPTPNRVFVVFHNDPNAHSSVNGFQLRHMVKPDEKPLAPSGLVKRYPELAAITRVEGRTESLFEDTRG